MTERLWLPHSAQIHGAKPTMFCTVIVDVDGGKCGAAFYEEKKWLDHIAICRRKHEAEIRHNSPNNKLAGFLEATGQPDVEEWLDREDAGGVSNRTKAQQGRKKL